MLNRWWVTTAFAAATLTVAACGSSSGTSGGSGASGGSSSSAASNPSSASASNVVKSAKIGSATVLTNASGRTLYWFVPDTSTKSNCNGSCAKFWPPLKGPVTGNGVSGKFSTITRSDGSTQATWNGHPLYTYVGDTAPGQDKGNGLNLSGGVWHAATLTGTVAVAPAPAASSSSSSGGGGGYGY
jgi:predicted lipoprotein with Yx(FWY)xxD motif